MKLKIFSQIDIPTREKNFLSLGKVLKNLHGNQNMLFKKMFHNWLKSITKENSLILSIVRKWISPFLFFRERFYFGVLVGIQLEPHTGKEFKAGAIVDHNRYRRLLTQRVEGDVYCSKAV